MRVRNFKISNNEFSITQPLVVEGTTATTPSENSLHRLGQLFECKLRDQEGVVCREIQFQRIKLYNIEDFLKEICQLHCLGLDKAVMPILGVNFDEKKHLMNIFMPKETSLFQILHTLPNRE